MFRLPISLEQLEPLKILAGMDYKTREKANSWGRRLTIRLKLTIC